MWKVICRNGAKNWHLDLKCSLRWLSWRGTDFHDSTTWQLPSRPPMIIVLCITIGQRGKHCKNKCREYQDLAVEVILYWVCFTPTEMWSLINDHIRSDGELFWVQICALPYADLLKMQFRWISENSSFGYEALALGTTSQATHIELWMGGGGRNIVQRCGVEQVMRYWKYILGMLHTYNRLFWQKILYGQHTLIKYNSINIIKYNILWEKDNQSFEHNFPLTCLEPNHLTCFQIGGRERG